MAGSRGKRRNTDALTDQLKRYRARLDGAKKWREQQGYDTLWERLIDLYRGRHFLSTLDMSSEDRIAVNIVFATINVIAPSVSVRHPKLLVQAQKNEDSLKATMIETILNYWWGQYDFQDELHLAVKDWLILGHGWLKVGWRYVEEPSDVKAQAQAAMAPDDDAAGDPNDVVPDDPKEHPADEVDDDQIDADPIMEATEDRPFVERVSPTDMLTSPEDKTMSSLRWIAQKTVKPWAEVKQDKKYRASARRTLKPDGATPKGLRQGDSDPSDDEKRVTIWEFYDLQMGTMCVFPEMGDEFLLDPIPQPYSFGHPFVMLRSYEVPDQFYPMGDVEALEPLQHELDATRSDLMNQRRAFKRKWIFQEGAFNTQGIEDLESDEPDVMVPYLGDLPINEAVAPLPINPPNPQMFQYMETVQNDMNTVSAVTEFQRGESSDVRHTATEASMMNDAANSRAQDKLAQVELVIGRIGKRIVQLAEQYMTHDAEVRVLGDNGWPQWVPVSPQDMKCECDFSVEGGSTQPVNEMQRRQQALQMLQTLTPYAASGLINTQELLKYTLQFGFGIKQPERFLMGQAPQQPGDKQKSPHESAIETLNYKDAPPDIQRQIEAQLGFQPSTVGGSSQAEQSLGSQVPQQAQQAQQATPQMQVMTAKHAHEASMLHEKHRHEMAMAQTGHAHKVLESAADHGEALQQSQQGAAQQQAAAAQQNTHQAGQQVLGAALTPPPPEPEASAE